MLKARSTLAEDNSAAHAAYCRPFAYSIVANDGTTFDFRALIVETAALLLTGNCGRNTLNETHVLTHTPSCGRTVGNFLRNMWHPPVLSSAAFFGTRRSRRMQTGWYPTAIVGHDWTQAAAAVGDYELAATAHRVVSVHETLVCFVQLWTNLNGKQERGSAVVH